MDDLEPCLQGCSTMKHRERTARQRGGTNHETISVDHLKMTSKITCLRWCTTADRQAWCASVGMWLQVYTSLARIQHARAGHARFIVHASDNSPRGELSSRGPPECSFVWGRAGVPARPQSHGIAMRQLCFGCQHGRAHVRSASCRNITACHETNAYGRCVRQATISTGNRAGQAP
jgi:hypothetical protein